MIVFGEVFFFLLQNINSQIIISVSRVLFMYLIVVGMAKEISTEEYI